MRSFNFVVTGCHNCPHNDKDTWCRKAGLDTPEEYQALSVDNYFILTKSCPEYSKTRVLGSNDWVACANNMPELEVVSEDWSISKVCIVSNGETFTLASYVSNRYGTSWESDTPIKNVTHWKYTDLP